MRYIGVFLGVLPLLGQSLSVSSRSAVAGEKVAIEIALNSPDGKEPAGVQFEASFPVEALKLEETGPTPGQATRSAGKSLTCAPSTKSSAASKWVCLVMGGQKPIANGVVAILDFAVQSGAANGVQAVVVDKALGVSTAFKKIPMARAEGAVKITR